MLNERTRVGEQVHVCGGREAKEQAVRRPGEQRLMKQNREAKERNPKSKRHESETT
jgi:hypothetical protein